jgi:hypothetical protein
VGKAWFYGDADQRELTRLLTADGSYLWDAAVGCEPDFGYRFTFRRADEKVVIVVCLQCQSLYIFRDDKRVGTEEFNPITKELKELIRKLP